MGTLENADGGTGKDRCSGSRKYVIDLHIFSLGK